jgi:hypothetical protein
MTSTHGYGIYNKLELNKINTCQKLDIYIPLVSLTKVQKEVFYSSITLFNSLPPNIKKVAHDINQFKHKLRKFLIVNFFYAVDEYFDWNNKFDFGVSQ